MSCQSSSAGQLETGEAVPVTDYYSNPCPSTLCARQPCEHRRIDGILIGTWKCVEFITVSERMPVCLFELSQNVVTMGVSVGSCLSY